MSQIGRKPGRMTASAVIWIGLATLGHAQSGAVPPALPKILGTEVSSEFSWERRRDFTLDAHTAVFGAEPFHITFSITYQGLKQSGAPDSVDLLLVREVAAPADAVEQPERAAAIAVIDELPAPLTKQTMDGPDRIRAVVPFEIFQWMVGGKALEFEAFGRRFVLAARQIAVLKQAGIEWEARN